MPRTTPSSGVPAAATLFTRFRRRFLEGIQQPQLRRAAFLAMALGAGLLPLMGGAARAALQSAPTDGADNMRMLVGAALVLLMTPGLAFFYGGFTRSKNVLNTMMRSFFLMGLIGVLWVVILFAGVLGLNRSFGAEVDRGTLSALLTAVVFGLACGVLPARRAARLDPVHALSNRD